MVPAFPMAGSRVAPGASLGLGKEFGAQPVPLCLVLLPMDPPGPGAVCWVTASISRKSSSSPTTAPGGCSSSWVLSPDTPALTPWFLPSPPAELKARLALSGWISSPLWGHDAWIEICWLVCTSVSQLFLFSCERYKKMNSGANPALSGNSALCEGEQPGLESEHRHRGASCSVAPALAPWCPAASRVETCGCS